jgi:hypothetical protein
MSYWIGVRPHRSPILLRSRLWRKDYFPLDRQPELRDKHYSEGALKEMVWLSGAVGSYEKA